MNCSTYRLGESTPWTGSWWVSYEATCMLSILNSRLHNCTFSHFIFYQIWIVIKSSFVLYSWDNYCEIAGTLSNNRLIKARKCTRLYSPYRVQKTGIEKCTEYFLYLQSPIFWNFLFLCFFTTISLEIGSIAIALMVFLFFFYFCFYFIWILEFGSY